MLEEIIAGQDDPQHLASLALGHLRAKTPQLRLALEGKIRPHHRFLLRRLLDQLHFVEHEIALLDERLEDIGRQCPELSQAVARWDTIPGIDRVAGWALLAEVGNNMAQFPTAEQLACWAALCPGNHESAGKRLRGTTSKGSPWLRRMACQCAWAAARTKNTYLSSQFRRLAARRGSKRAIIAVAHSLIVYLRWNASGRAVSIFTVAHEFAHAALRHHEPENLMTLSMEEAKKGYLEWNSEVAADELAAEWGYKIPKRRKREP
jgi:transposase